MGLRTGLDGRKISSPRDSNVDRPARSQSLYRLSYRAHNNNNNNNQLNCSEYGSVIGFCSRKTLKIADILLALDEMDAKTVQCYRVNVLYLGSASLLFQVRHPHCVEYELKYTIRYEMYIIQSDTTFYLIKLY